MKRLTFIALLALTSCTYVEPEPFSDYIGTSPPSLDAPRTRQVQGMTVFDETGPIELTIEDAVLAAVSYNQALAVESITPDIRRTFERQLQALFDPVISASGAYSRERIAGDNIGDTTTSGVDVDAAAAVELPTGTAIEAQVATAYESPPGRNDRYASRIGVSMTQALLRGAGSDVNLVSLRQARLDTITSQYELRGFVQALVAQVQITYWNYMLAQKQIDIFEQSLDLARQQLRDTQERIRIGRLPETEEAAAQAQVALRKENLINARSELSSLRVRLLRLINPPGEVWNRVVIPVDLPSPPQADLDDVESHVTLALRARPELNQARLLIARNELEVIRTRNGLLPRLDLFVTLGKTGYAESFGQSIADALSEPSYDILAGARMEFPPLNRSARAEHARARLSVRQAQESLENLDQLVQVDVRLAHLEVQRLAQQVQATAATRELQEEVYRTENAKFSVGRSTSYLVAQAQRDLLSSQIAEVRAIVDYLNAMVELYRLDGSLLERLGIVAPGAVPPDDVELY